MHIPAGSPGGGTYWVEPNQVYVIPPNTTMVISGGALTLTARAGESFTGRSMHF